MKAKLPRSVRLDAQVEARLSKLLDGTSKAGLKFPDILNFAVSRLIDEMDKGAKIIVDETGPHLVWVQMPDEIGGHGSHHAQSNHPFGAKSARR